MKNTFFITGTDTDVGKTLISAGLLQAANTQGLSTYGLKPLAAGGYQRDGQWRNQDADLLMQYSSVKLAYAQVNPMLFSAPKAPHIAAEDTGRTIELSRLVGFCRGALMNKADFKLIEGAGGWRVPLNSREMLSGLPQKLNLPVILVVGLRLGCINHSLLTMEAILRDGLTLAGWVANVIDSQMDSVDDNIGTLTSLIPAPLLGVSSWQDQPDVDIVAHSLNISSLLS